MNHEAQPVRHQQQHAATLNNAEKTLAAWAGSSPSRNSSPAVTRGWALYPSGASVNQSAANIQALVGTLHPENLGIECIIQNTLANPHVRFLLVCGEDTQQRVGHLPGACLLSLFSQGIDERGPHPQRPGQAPRPELRPEVVRARRSFSFPRQPLGVPMKTSHSAAGLALLAALVVGTLGYKTLSSGDAAPRGLAEAGRPAAVQSVPRVVLVADMREAEESCGCGAIIRRVRAAAAKGVPVREVDVVKEPEGGKPYGVTSAPTVVLLDEKGQVVQRLVGEGTDVQEALGVALTRLNAERG